VIGPLHRVRKPGEVATATYKAMIDGFSTAAGIVPSVEGWAIGVAADAGDQRYYEPLRFPPEP